MWRRWNKTPNMPHFTANSVLGGIGLMRREMLGETGLQSQRPATGSRNAAICSPLRTSRTSPASAG
jgi:hypothetical protein